MPHVHFHGVKTSFFFSFTAIILETKKKSKQTRKLKESWNVEKNHSYSGQYVEHPCKCEIDISTRIWFSSSTKSLEFLLFLYYVHVLYFYVYTLYQRGAGRETAQCLCQTVKDSRRGRQIGRWESNRPAQGRIIWPRCWEWGVFSH